MPIDTFNSNDFPMSLTSVSGQLPAVPTTVPVDIPRSKGNPVEGVTAPIQVIGLVPVFKCESDECRAGLYKADFVADDTQYTLPVFAYPLSAVDSYHNDFNSWMFQYPGNHNPISLNEFKLQEYASGVWTTIATLNNSTYGVVYNNDGQPNGGKCAAMNTYGYRLDWKKVYAAFGEGTYRFYVSGQYTGTFPYCYASPPFCLKAWDCVAVDGTVKFEATYRGGNFGSVTTQGRQWSFCCKTSTNPVESKTYPINWYDSIRIWGSFNSADFDKEVDSIKYQPGEIAKVRDELIKKFKLIIGGGGSTKNIPMWMLERFAAYALEADKLYVSDYNINNPNYNLKKFWVVCDTGMKPSYTGASRYMKVLNTEFKEGRQFIWRDRCC